MTGRRMLQMKLPLPIMWIIIEDSTSRLPRNMYDDVNYTGKVPSHSDFKYLRSAIENSGKLDFVRQTGWEMLIWQKRKK